MTTSDSIIIVIDGTPIAKGRPKHRIITKGGKSFTQTYTPKKTRGYENKIKDAASFAMRGLPLIEGAVAVRVNVYRAIPTAWSKKNIAEALAGNIRPTTKPDIDNHVKAAFDGLNMIVIKDDSQIVSLNSRKYYSDKPRLEIEVIPL